MNPQPCKHCGNNFMMAIPESDLPKLCNNCLLKEDIRLGVKKEKMDTINILIKLPKEIHKEIEEICISEGIDLSKYFLKLYEFGTSGVLALGDCLNLTPEQQKTLQVDESLNETRPRGRPKKL